MDKLSRGIKKNPVFPCAGSRGSSDWVKSWGNVYFDKGTVMLDTPRPPTHGTIGKTVTHWARLERYGKAFLGSPNTSACDDWSVCRLAAAASSSQMFAAGDCPLQNLQPAQTTEVPGWGGSRTTALPQPYFILLLSVLSSQGPSCCKPWHPWILHGNINITVITQARFNTVRNSQIFLEEKKMFSRREASLCKLYTNMWMCVRRTSGRLHARHNVRGIKNMEKDAKF